MRSLFRCLSFLLLLAGVTASTLPRAAASVLVPEVRDDGGFFSAEAIKKANAVIKDIKDHYDKDLVIETYKAIPKDLQAQFEKEGKERFFREWTRSRAKRLDVNGIIILICKDPGHLEVEVGNTTGQKAFPTSNRDKLVSLMLEKFRAKDYDRALVEGTEYVQQALKTNLGKKAEVGSEYTPNDRFGRTGRTTSQSSWFSGIGGLLCMGLLLVLGIWLIVGLIRAFTGGGGGGYGGMGGGGMGGGGFMTGLLGGMFGAMAGSWIYDSFFRGSSWGSSAYGSDYGANNSAPQDTDYSGGGGDFDGGDTGNGGGGDFGGGGGGDFGGGGGDFGGGGGDFGGGGGGDFGGGGGDFGGGGGDF